MQTLIGLVAPQWHTYLVIAASVIATASLAGKLLEAACLGGQQLVQAFETVIAAISVKLPNAAKANAFCVALIAALSTFKGVCASLVAFCAHLQSSALLQGLALNPAPGAPSHPVTAPGGGTVNMPSASTAAKVGALLLALALPFQAKAQIAAPTAGKWEVGLLTPGLRFPLTGGAPAAIAAGSGLGLSYLIPGPTVVLPLAPKDPVSGKPVQTPVFGVTGIAQGSFNLSNLAETESATVGLGIIFVDRITLAWLLDLVQGGPNGPTGALTGHLSLANTGPACFWSFPLN